MHGMKTSNYPHDLVARYGDPVRVEVVACGPETPPLDRFGTEVPLFVDNDGRCTNCGQLVEFETLGPLNEYVYTRAALPHTRERRWFTVSEDDLLDLEDYAAAY